MSEIDDFGKALAVVQVLTPREVRGKKIAQAIYKRQVVTVVGIKTTTSRFLPVSHAGYSNETYVDKVYLLGKDRAEFIGRKLKGIERRSHMALFRQWIEAIQRRHKEEELKDKTEDERRKALGAFEADWRMFFATHFGTKQEEGCTIPDKLCLACWNCSLFGGMESQIKKAGTFSRIRYFDTFSVEDAAECVQTDDSPEQMAIGNVVYEDLSREGEEKTRGAESFHRYEYVKAGTRFPFITIIESPTLLDVAGYLAAVKLADQHGYGKYSANHGKFKTEFLAISTGYPLFSVLDMLMWFENAETEKSWNGASDGEGTKVNATVNEQQGVEEVQGNISSNQKSESSLPDKLKFEDAIGGPVSLYGDQVAEIQKKLGDEFTNYLAALDSTPQDNTGGTAGRGRRGRRG